MSRSEYDKSGLSARYINVTESASVSENDEQCECIFKISEIESFAHFD